MSALTPEAVVAGLTAAQRATCETCQGRGFWQSYPGSEEWPCTWCADPDQRSVSLLLERATPEQKSLLLWGEATLAYQPMTPAEWDEHLCSYYVEDDDGEDLGDGFIWPATKHWFAGSSATLSDPIELKFKFNAAGLQVRTLLQADPQP